LRGAHAIAPLGREGDSSVTHRDVCAVPRRIAYARVHDPLHNARAEGKLVTLAAASTAKARTLDT
jgi:hypothetical protein